MATQTNISFYRGEDVVLLVTMSPVTNITGWTLQFTLKKNYGDATALITLTTTGGGITITNAAGGVFTVAVASLLTLLPYGTYVYDIQRIDSGSRTVLCAGALKLLPEVAL